MTIMSRRVFFAPVHQYTNINQNCLCVALLLRYMYMYTDSLTLSTSVKVKLSDEKRKTRSCKNQASEWERDAAKAKVVVTDDVIYVVIFTNGRWRSSPLAATRSIKSVYTMLHSAESVSFQLFSIFLIFFRDVLAQATIDLLHAYHLFSSQNAQLVFSTTANAHASNKASVKMVYT